MKKVLVFKEKHGRRTFDASDEALLGKACLKVVRDRLDDDFWYLDDDHMPAFRKGAAPAARDILDLASKEPEKAGKLAYRFLKERSGYEYEGFTIESVEEV